MPKIDEIAFARLVSAGKVFRNTCLLYATDVDAKWWRKNGMVFSPEDFDGVLAKRPEVVVLGTGFMNRVSIPEATTEKLAAAGIEVIILESKAAAEKYNELLSRGRKVIGAFQLM